jgi:hypothetical protein
VYALHDDPRESVSAAIQAAEVAKRAGQRRAELMALLNASETFAYVGRWDEALRSLAELAGRELSTEYAQWSECIDAVVVAGTGDPERALDLLEAFAEATESTDYVHMRSTHLCARGFVLLCAGDLPAAWSAARDGAAADPLGINAAECLAVAARAALWQADAGAARTALEGLESFRGRFATATRLTVLAGLAALAGDRQDAAECYRTACAAWRALDCRLQLALGVLDWVILLGPDETDPAAVAEAAAIFTALGATPFLGRLEGVGRLSRDPPPGLLERI